jgi:hypothetical protein
MAENFMEQNRMENMPHLPYSHDLVPCNFFLFPLVKKRLDQFECDDPDDLLEPITEILGRLTICTAFSRSGSTESESWLRGMEAPYLIYQFIHPWLMDISVRWGWPRDLFHG